MPEQTEFVNLYIQSLVKEVEELTKVKILAIAKEAFKDLEIGELTKRIEDLDESVVKTESHEVNQIADLQNALLEKNEKNRGLEVENKELKNMLLSKEEQINSLYTRVRELSGALEASKIREQAITVEAKDVKKPKGNKRAVHTA
jgi:hypothetical protein